MTIKAPSNWRKSFAFRATAGAALLASISACSMMGPEKPPLPTVSYVDLQRYMGPWYIVASVPLDFERGAHDAVETYALNPDGSIATVFQRRQDRFDGEQKTSVTQAWVVKDSGNAVWKVRVIWPFSGEYRISWLSPDYSVAIIARSKRDHVWVLSRNPLISEAMYSACRDRIAAMGYDMSQFRRVPQNGAHP
jgi:apolipoprotein D and lipocalin family protein